MPVLRTLALGANHWEIIVKNQEFQIRLLQIFLSEHQLTIKQIQSICKSQYMFVCAHNTICNSKRLTKRREGASKRHGLQNIPQNLDRPGHEFT